MKRKTINQKITVGLAGVLLSVIPIKEACSQIPGPPEFTQRDSWNTPLSGGALPKPTDDVSLSHWWSVFGDPELTSLEERALKANLDLRTAVAEIHQSQASRFSATGSLYPSLTGTITGTGNRSASHSGAIEIGGQSLNLGSAGSSGASYTQNYSAEAEASWEPDFFHGLHKTVAAYDKDIQAAQENLRNTMVTLTAELATDYVNVRSYQAQIKVTQENLVEYRDTYETTLEKRQSGLSSDVDVQEALENVQSTEATLPSLETSLKQETNAIAVLLGERPGAVDGELATVQPVPVIPAEVAVGIPADLLRRRPDVRKAERQYEAQALRVGVAKANLYPTFTLTSTFSTSVTNFLDVLTPATMVSSVAGSVAQTFLNRRNLKGQLKLQNADLDQDEVAYESAVLGAVQDVENALQAFGAEQVRRKSLRDAVVSAQNSADMSRELYGSGLSDFLTLLDSERTLLSVQNSLVQSDATVATNLITLYKVMGGGWR